LGRSDEAAWKPNAHQQAIQRRHGMQYSRTEVIASERGRHVSIL
jgi:hypothetical protein